MEAVGLHAVTVIYGYTVPIIQLRPCRRQDFAPHIDGTGAGTVCHQYGRQSDGRIR